MTIWFTSDTHYGHKNIIKYNHRPFSSVEEMDEQMIQRWNDIVVPGDIVYHLGDFAFYSDRKRIEEVLTRLKGQKHLIMGNHDEKRAAQGNSHWASVGHYKRIKVDGQRVILLHYAMKVWHGSHRGAWQLYGHSHGSLKEDFKSKQFDVGVDCWNYTPISYEKVAEEMGKREFVPVDHHGADDKITDTPN